MVLDFLIPITAIFFVIGVPVMSLATHFVLRPLVRDITGAIHGKKKIEQEDLLGRIARLEEVVIEQNKQIERLADAEVFRRRLEAGETREELPV
jgi:hypothetical protein